jgi:hypothetical protein
MQHRLRAALLVAGLAALLVIPALPGSQAQVPDVYQTGGRLLTQVDVSVDPPSLDVPRLGQVVFQVTVRDLSADKQQSEGVAHIIQLDLDTNRTASPGWVAFISGQNNFQTQAGDIVHTQVTVQAPPTIKTAFFHGTVRARLTSLLVGNATNDADIVARVIPFSLASVDIRAAPQTVGPDETAEFPVHVTNDGLYPDTFTIEATGPDNWFVDAQPRTILFPGESRDVPIHVITPALRVFTPQETGIITVRVASVNDPATVYERSAVITLEGTYLPGYWGPLLALGAVAGGSLVARSVEAGKRRNRELGKPLPPRLTPAQAVALQALKKEDPARYRAISRGQRKLFLARQRAFASVRTRRMRLETALLSQERTKDREEEYERKVQERLARQKEQELGRARARVERAKRDEARRAAAEEKRREQAAERARRRAERMAAPTQRKEERERKVRERKLQAELRRKRRVVEAEQRRRRVELERRKRVLERQQREAERRAGRGATTKKGKGGK